MLVCAGAARTCATGDPSQRIERRYARFQFDARVFVMRPGKPRPTIGRTLELSASGISAVVASELDMGEIVKLTFALEGCDVAVTAVVRSVEQQLNPTWTEEKTVSGQRGVVQAAMDWPSSSAHLLYFWSGLDANG